MPPRRRVLNEADRAAWAGYARTIAPLKGHTVQRLLTDDHATNSAVLPPVAPERSDKLPTASPPRINGKPRPAPLAVGDNPGGLDRRTWERLRTGKLVAVRTLDLHGMTVQHAFHALTSFLHSAHAERVRCVEIVTGRGTGENGGAIRRELPLWLNRPDIRPLVLGATHPHALNPGSVRLLLRRVR